MIIFPKIEAKFSKTQTLFQIILKISVLPEWAGNTERRLFENRPCGWLGRIAGHVITDDTDLDR